jgi:hypothetical protein
LIAKIRLGRESKPGKDLLAYFAKNISWEEKCFIVDNVLKLFTVVIYKRTKEAIVFVISRAFHPSLMF